MHILVYTYYYFISGFFLLTVYFEYRDFINTRSLHRINVNEGSGLARNILSNFQFILKINTSISIREKLSKILIRL